MQSNNKILNQFKEHKTITDSGLDLQYQQAKLNHMLYNGDEMAYKVGVTEGKTRKIVVFNRIKPLINAIVGFMIQLRREPDYQARLPDQEQQRLASKATNEFSQYIRSDANCPQVETRQDKETLITGVGAIEQSISYVKNPYGDVVTEALKFDEVGWDPQSRTTNLLDARWVFRRKIMNREDAVEFFNADEEDFEDVESPILNTCTGNLQVVNKDQVDEDLVQVFYYQWWEFQNYYTIENPLYDETIDPLIKQEIAQAFEIIQNDIIEENADADVIEDLFSFSPEAMELVVTTKTRALLLALFDEYGVLVDELKQKRKVYYTAIISGKKVFSSFKAKDQNGFTIKFKTGDYDEVNQVWHGVVEQLREPSRYANKALTEILYVIANNSKGGVLYEQDAVSDPRRFEQQWASTDAAIRVNPGALGGGKIQPKAQSALPSGYENVLNIAKQGLFETSGINPEFLGSSENKQVSGILEAQRIEQVKSGLASYFDSITLYQKEIARLALTDMRVLYENNPLRLVPVMGEDGVKAWDTISESALFAEYVIDVQEQPITAVQKSDNLALMLGVAQNMLMAGQNIYPELIDDMPIRQSLKDSLKKKLNPQLTPEQQQAQQKEQELLMQSKMLELQGKTIDNTKKQTETEKIRTDIAKTAVDMDKSRADTTKTLEEAEKLDLENEQLSNVNNNQISFTI